MTRFVVPFLTPYAEAKAGRRLPVAFAGKAGTLEQEVFVLEPRIGVGLFARFFLDHFKELCRKDKKGTRGRKQADKQIPSCEAAYDGLLPGFSTYPSSVFSRISFSTGARGVVHEGDNASSPLLGRFHEMAPAEQRGIFGGDRGRPQPTGHYQRADVKVNRVLVGRAAGVMAEAAVRVSAR